MIIGGMFVVSSKFLEEFIVLDKLRKCIWLRLWLEVLWMRGLFKFSRIRRLLFLGLWMVWMRLRSG